ncbi:MAG TPA: DUF305 domain-containing protein [Anaerolineales bacterium]|nr:DUF305 domain-containing protein [Anaerolineales bacterium]
MNPSNQTAVDESAPSSASRWFDPPVLWVFVSLVLGVVLGFWGGQQSMRPPTEDSAEVGFARDMANHHAQAVTMAQLVYDRTDDENMRLLALDIMLTQQAQIGQMQGWLTTWERPLSTTTPAMTWMGMPTSALMPGMATAEEINRLRGLKGTEADGLFLQLMIPHHRGGVEMANAVLEYTQRAQVVAMAQAIVNSQTTEIAYMQQLLHDKGFPPVPEETSPHHAP